MAGDILSKYKKVKSFTVAKELQEALDLNWKQREFLQAFFDSNYTIISYEKYEPVSGWYRLTILFYFLYFIILVIGQLVKWLFTGKRYYSEKGWMLKLFRAWTTRLKL